MNSEHSDTIYSGLNQASIRGIASMHSFIIILIEGSTSAPDPGKHEHFWDAGGNRKWAVFTFNLPSHNHIHIVKYLFSIRDE